MTVFIPMEPNRELRSVNFSIFPWHQKTYLGFPIVYLILLCLLAMGPLHCDMRTKASPCRDVEVAFLLLPLRMLKSVYLREVF